MSESDEISSWLRHQITEIFLIEISESWHLILLEKMSESDEISYCLATPLPNIIFFEWNLVQAGNTSYFLIVAMKFHCNCQMWDCELATTRQTSVVVLDVTSAGHFQDIKNCICMQQHPEALLVDVAPETIMEQW